MIVSEELQAQVIVLEELLAMLNILEQLLQGHNFSILCLLVLWLCYLPEGAYDGYEYGYHMVRFRVECSVATCTLVLVYVTIRLGDS